MSLVALASPPTKFGFRAGERGTLTSRTIMVAELTTLLGALPASAYRADYWKAIAEENVLAKKTAATRRLTAQRLSELYALDPNVTLFRLLRFFWDKDPVARPLLAVLCACARDPLLRMTADPVLHTRPGDPMSKAQFEEAVAEETTHRFNPSTLNKIARNAASSWTQSGHLIGRSVKQRQEVQPTAAATAYALALGYLAGGRGSLLFHRFWTALLDAPEYVLHDLAREASKNGWITFRGTGGVMDVELSGLLNPAELKALHDQA